MQACRATIQNLYQLLLVVVYKEATMDFTFSHPQYLFFLFAIPLVIFIHFLALSHRKKKALRFANFDAIARIQGVDFFSKNVVVLLLYLVILVLVVFAISGFTLQTSKEATSFSFVLAIDSSQSMSATDFSPSRMEVAKETAKRFVDLNAQDVRIAVISFSGSTKVEKDLTNRKPELKTAIDGIEISGFGGTDIYEAVLTSTNMLRFESHKAIILLSDGQINVGTLDDAVEYANDHDVIVHAIGMGTLSGGETDYGFSRLDEDSLTSIAYETGGVYVSAENEAEVNIAFDDIFNEVERKVSIELYYYFLVAVLVLIVLVFFISNTRYVNLP